MTTLFQIIEDRASYYSEPKFTPGFNVSVVFFLHRKKTGYMSFDFRGKHTGSARYSHYVSALEKHKSDLRQYGGSCSYTPLNEKGLECVRQFLLASGVSTAVLKPH